MRLTQRDIKERRKMYEELVKALRETRESVRRHPDVAMYVPPYQLSAAADAIEELSKPRWIPVTERLPENQQFVLAWKDEKPKGFACICLWMDNAGWAFKNITHWMPLPEPPDK